MRVTVFYGADRRVAKQTQAEWLHLICEARLAWRRSATEFQPHSMESWQQKLAAYLIRERSAVR